MRRYQTVIARSKATWQSRKNNKKNSDLQNFFYWIASSKLAVSSRNDGKNDPCRNDVKL
ncbi:hypothetical protein [Rickettsia felis]|uniref:hypothetical protein n=1 Tax=Rickettsia felis TaxID=42862 RepID=UPI000A54D975|nr:hypothetical protein [Rickettsia felis]